MQEKLERLVDSAMRNIGASKLSLSSISSEELWQRSGRLEKYTEHLRIKDRNNLKFILSPTHEEEITELVSSTVRSYKDLPLRLYQISRKYRDERRPRQGLLRAKEFLMKDLYTFDTSPESAQQTYLEVKEAYDRFFTSLGLPFAVAEADSGDMGGNKSDEFHFISPIGEDRLFHCSKCNYTANEEVMNPAASDAPATTKLRDDTTTSPPKNDTGSTNVDVTGKSNLPPRVDDFQQVNGAEAASTAHSGTFLPSQAPENIACPRCSQQSLTSRRAIEVGHTFYLGTRYSEKLRATFADVQDQQIPIQMGCYGIGMSRIIGAAASLLSTASGLRWPPVIAPFKVVIVSSKGTEADAEAIYDALTGHELDKDVLLDDRDESLGWKLTDSDLIGYPIAIILGKRWKDEGCIDIKCRLPDQDKRTGGYKAALQDLLHDIAQSLGGQDRFRASQDYAYSESRKFEV